MKTGIIFSIEEFAIHDGPGIRTNIFLKGCPLRCTWCHNPEGISPKPQEMVKKGERTICGYEMSSTELAEQILKNKNIYRLNEGGITFTGGEPLMQPEFIIDVLNKIKPNIHTAIETSGHTTAKIFQKVVPMFDLVMVDIKHTNSATHKKYTGVDNKLILQNLEFLCSSNIDFIIRIPLIPEVNDTEENMRNISNLIKDAKSLVRVEIMRYHKTAGAKYAMIGEEYAPLFDTEKTPHIYNNVFEKSNIKTIIL